ncbi:restriction endonuclease subunit S [Clostridium perfringens]|uniref:restriction endonuclease subunit S n=1 Tax=Clostridium perfringens TaxID=1502 RepID=UPI001A319AB7|nr:restriction endonuclease subunit S [Clostridium perfringens]MDG6877581.1 Type I restriction modification DNA specificity domain protein [Clostridium perfringens]UBL07822.1 restriction endonuclease subunit S [Clostridium perfringens]WFD85783.1 restriction endonuclease subunit S [Clostridium perfringens]WFD98596.1 restriction endonuclease subunit S [Clostridium perfringens]HAT4229906.1 restriction endonuclease subunit S [Clostridium perfringens]
MSRNVPKLRFKGFEDEWKEKKLINFLSESRIPGSNGSKAKKLTVKLWAKGVVPKKEIYEGSDNTKYYTRKAGQLIYGKLDFLNCAFGIVPDHLDGYESTVDAPAFDIKNINPYFLFSKIIQKNFYKRNGDIADGSRKAKRIHSDVFLNMSIKVPSLQEQEKIANFLSKVDSIIEKQEKKVEYWNSYKKGMMQKIFSQKIRFKDENGMDYPEWKINKIENIATIEMGFTPSTKNDEAWNGNIEWLSIAGMNSKYIYSGNKKISSEILGKRKLVPIDTLIMSFKLTIGRLAIVKKEIVTNEAICQFYWKSKDISNEYMYAYLSVINIESFGCRAAKGITLNTESLNSIVVKLPCLEEQTKIANFLSNIDNIIEKESKKLEELKQWKKGLLQQMFV